MLFRSVKLSAMDEILAGKTAFIQANQSLESFVKEELSKHDPKVTVTQYIESDHFKSGKFIPEDFLNAGYTPDIAKKQSFDEFSKTKDSSDSSPAPTEAKGVTPPKSSKEVDDDGAPLMEKAEVMPASKYKSTAPEPIVESAAVVAPEISPVASLRLDGDLTPPAVKAGFFSGVEMHQTPIRSDPYFTISYGNIPAGDPITFQEGFLKELLSFASKSRFYLAPVKGEIKTVF